MGKPRKKRRQSGGRRQIETSLPKRQYKRVNRLVYVFSGLLLVVFGGGAALIGAGTPPAPTNATVPAPAIVETLTGNPAEQGEQFTATSTPAPATATPIP